MKMINRKTLNLKGHHGRVRLGADDKTVEKPRHRKRIIQEKDGRFYVSKENDLIRINDGDPLIILDIMRQNSYVVTVVVPGGITWLVYDEIELEDEDQL